MGMLEVPGTLKAQNITMDADVTAGGDSVGNKYSEKFSFVDSIPATDGLGSDELYTYTVTGSGNMFAYAKLTLSGKDGKGLHRTAEIEVFNGELQSLFLSNIASGEINVAVYGNTVRVQHSFGYKWYFTNHVEGYTGVLGNGRKYFGNRAIFISGGDPTGVFNTMDYVKITTSANAVDFGEVTQGRSQAAAFSDGSRGIFAGGSPGPSPAESNIIEYFNIGVLSDGTDFGDLTQARYQIDGTSNGVRGVVAGGTPPGEIDTIDYITIQTLGDALDFGELFQARRLIAATSDGNRAVFGGGYDGSSNVNTMDYINVDHTGDATDFGEIHTARRDMCGMSDGVKGVFCGGDSGDAIQIFTIAYPSNATDYAELSQARGNMGAASNGDRGLIGGGDPNLTTIDYMYFSGSGDAVDFGDLTQGRGQNRATSGD